MRQADELLELEMLAPIIFHPLIVDGSMGLFPIANGRETSSWRVAVFPKIQHHGLSSRDEWKPSGDRKSTARLIDVFAEGEQPAVLLKDGKSSRLILLNFDLDPNRISFDKYPAIGG